MQGAGRVRGAHAPGALVAVSYSGVGVSRLLVEGMRVASLNHRVLANNIANADTPNFTPTAVNFQDTLKAALDGRDRVALRTTRSRHIPLTRQTAKFERIAYLSKNDYNKVDLDEQLAALAENTGRFTTYTGLLSQRHQAMRTTLSALNR